MSTDEEAGKSQQPDQILGRWSTITCRIYAIVGSPHSSVNVLIMVGGRITRVLGPFNGGGRDLSLTSFRTNSGSQAAYCQMGTQNQNGRCVNVTTHIRIEPRLRMCGAVPQLLHALLREIYLLRLASNGTNKDT